MKGQTRRRGTHRGRPGTKKRRRRRTVLAVVVILLLIFVAAAATTAVRHGKTSSDRKPVTLAEGQSCVVCVDPGHGGDDPGGMTEGRLEKDDNLAVGLALREALEARGITVVMTREDDSTLSLEERVAAAEDAGADYFLSVHRNLSEDDACGVEIWVAEGCSEQSQQLAARIEENLCAAGIQKDRGVRAGSQDGSGSYYVLRTTSMPAVLVELGFLQDAEDNRLLDRHTEDYAAAIADAVAEVFGEN